MPNQEELMFQKLADTKKTGYLNENFRLFHIRDQKSQEFDCHYHDFHKIVILISGQVTYFVEGKAYYLKPWDILLVGRYDIHRPVISSELPYERIVIWIKNEFIENQKPGDDNLAACFSHAEEENFHMVQLSPDNQLMLRELMFHLESSLNSSEFAAPQLCTALFLQFFIYINRIFLRQKTIKDSANLRYDKQIEEILRYINQNLTGNLSNERLAEQFYLSKYHLMHKFKKETGYTLHNYIEQKRLSSASDAIRKGTPVMKAAKDSGFMDYSTFLRAFRKKYGMSPKDYYLRKLST